eukprot:7282359-Pyramimonas_sp.AAC.1
MLDKRTTETTLMVVELGAGLGAHSRIDLETSRVAMPNSFQLRDYADHSAINPLLPTSLFLSLSLSLSLSLPISQ